MTNSRRSQLTGSGRGGAQVPAGWTGDVTVGALGAEGDIAELSPPPSSPVLTGHAASLLSY